MSTISSQLAAAAARFNPLATSTGSPTADAPVIFQLGEHEVTQDLTPLGNQAIRKIHDSVIGAPRKIEDFFSGEVPAFSRLEHTAPSTINRRSEQNELLKELLKRDQDRSMTPQENDSDSDLESDSENEEKSPPNSTSSKIAPPRSIMKSTVTLAASRAPQKSTSQKTVLWRDRISGAKKMPLTDVKEFS